MKSSVGHITTPAVLCVEAIGIHIVASIVQAFTILGDQTTQTSTTAVTTTGAGAILGTPGIVEDSTVTTMLGVQVLVVQATTTVHHHGVQQITPM